MSGSGSDEIRLLMTGSAPTTPTAQQTVAAVCLGLQRRASQDRRCCRNNPGAPLSEGADGRLEFSEGRFNRNA